ncbi:MAG: acetyltransferase [Acidobacteriota bacterium]
MADYGTCGVGRLFADWIKTRLFFPSARLVRFPVQVRGKRWIDFGQGLTTGRGCRIDAFPSRGIRGKLIRFGHSVQINDYVHIASVNSIEIGNRVLIASHVFISDHNHGRYSGPDSHSSPSEPPAMRLLCGAAVVIEDDVWIGDSVAILPGVTIGRGAVIGALSVVNRSVPAYCIAAGNPARVLKLFNSKTGRWDRT